MGASCFLFSNDNCIPALTSRSLFRPPNLPLSTQAKRAHTLKLHQLSEATATLPRSAKRPLCEHVHVCWVQEMMTRASRQQQRAHLDPVSAPQTNLGSRERLRGVVRWQASGIERGSQERHTHLSVAGALLDVLQQVVERFGDGRGGGAQILQRLLIRRCVLQPERIKQVKLHPQST